MPGRLSRFLRVTARGAGRRAERAKRAFEAGRVARATALPTDEQGRARLVCRRYAERRAVAVDDQARPDCYEADHPDCEGCVEDIRTGRVETW